MATFWESFHVDPREPGNAHLRASDADRDIVRNLLDQAFADGRLTASEFDTRVVDLLKSRTFGELPPLVADLVPANGQTRATAAALPAPDLRARAEARWRRQMRDSFVGFLIPSVVCLVVWAVTSQGFFWPIFPIVATGLNVIQNAVRRESIIEDEMRRLEKKAAKEQGRELPASDD